MPLDWIEEDFEYWFRRQATLPSGERLVIVRSHYPFGAVVDLLAVDHDATPVSIEVKAERAKAGVVDQILRYLPGTHGLSIGDLRKMYDGPTDLDSDFRSAFGRDLPDVVPKARRLAVVAPSFGFEAGMIVDCLRTYMPQVSFQLLRATRLAEEAFELRAERHLPLQRVSHLEPLTVAVRPEHDREGGRLVVVLEQGEPVLWQIGHLRDGQVELLSADTTRHRALRRENWLLAPLSECGAVDLSHHAKVFRRRTKPHVTARVLGHVRAGGQEWVVYHRMEADVAVGFHRRLRSTFEEKWEAEPSLAAPETWLPFAH